MWRALPATWQISGESIENSEVGHDPRSGSRRSNPDPENVAVTVVVMFHVDLLAVADIDVVCDALWSAGVLGVEEIELGDGHTRIRSSFGLDAMATTERLKHLFEEGLGEDVWTLTQVDPVSADTWKQFARPVEITPDLVVIPAWLDDPVGTSHSHKIFIDPGTTFGMGDHQTTRGCLLMLTKILQTGQTVLDVGCGSGVLGITAIRLGASHATGIDINPAAIPVSLDNARRNSIESQWDVSVDTLDTFEEKFDVVIANILAPVLIELASDLLRLVAPRGTLGISGILTDRCDHVLEALRPFEVFETIDIEGWITIALRP
jgi:ribosomal protein L11 methyltransferase